MIMKKKPTKINDKQYDVEDVFLWPDGVWCYRYEVEEYSYKSDDYEVVKVGTIKWYDVVE